MANIAIAVLVSAIALWAVTRLPLTEEAANNVRRQLGEQRGKV